MGIGYPEMKAAGTTAHFIDVDDDQNTEWGADDDGVEGSPAEFPELVLKHGDDLFIIRGSLDDMGDLLHRMNLVYRDAVDKARKSAPLPPAVTFDEEAFYRWLAAPAYRGSTRTNADEIHVPEEYRSEDHDIETLVEDAIINLNHSGVRNTNQDPWRIASDVTDVSAYAVDEPLTGKGLVAAVNVERRHVDELGIDLHVRLMDFTDLLSGAPASASDNPDGFIHMTGVDALTLAMRNLADAVNAVVRRWRERSRPIKQREGLAAELSDDDIECALRTLAEVTNCGDNADLSAKQRDIMHRLEDLWVIDVFGDEDDSDDEPRQLVWESAGTDEPGDQNASSRHIPQGCTGAYYQVGPNSDGGWSLTLITNGPGGVGEVVLGQHAAEDTAKQAAQNAEDRLSH